MLFFSFLDDCVNCISFFIQFLEVSKFKFVLFLLIILNHFLDELLGAISFCHKSTLILSLLKPCCHSVSTNILKLSTSFGLSCILSILIVNSKVTLQKPQSYGSASFIIMLRNKTFDLSRVLVVLYDHLSFCYL
jgi:hypothetical protein